MTILTSTGLSFAAWLVPLVGPHAVHLVGAALLRAADDPRRRTLEWAAVAVAQGTLVLVLVLLRRSSMATRAGAFAAAWVLCAVGLNAAIMVAIPVATLIEPETRSERVGFVPECEVPGASLDARSVAPEVAAAGEALLAPHGGSHLERMSMPGCGVERTDIPVNATVVSMRRGGRALYGLLPPPGDRHHWFVTGDGATRPIDLAGWDGRWGRPRLLGDGRTIGWVKPMATAAGYAPQEPPWATLRLRDADGAGYDVALGGERGRFELLDGAGADGPFVMAHEARTRTVFPVDREGRAGPALLPEPAARRDRAVFVNGGWLAWDVYAEARRYIVEWDVPAGRGRVEIPRGSGVTSAAVDAGGRYVAYSTTTNLSIGTTRDSVVLVRAADASEVYRRYFPRYHRAEVALLGEPPWFAVTDTEGTTPVVRVYRLP